MQKPTFLILLACLIFQISCGKKERIPVVIISTNFGDMTLVLSDKIPKHSANFVKHIKEGFYDSLTFHRVVRDMIIQGGEPKTHPGHPPTIKDHTLISAEFDPSLFHKRGALAAARYDNPAKASDPTQFYIVHGKKFSDRELNVIEGQSGRNIPKDQREIYKTEGGVPHLDQEYTVFGELIDGFRTLDLIATAQTNPETEVPLKDIRMTIKLDTITR